MVYARCLSNEEGIKVRLHIDPALCARRACGQLIEGLDLHRQFAEQQRTINPTQGSSNGKAKAVTGGSGVVTATTTTTGPPGRASNQTPPTPPVKSSSEKSSKPTSGTMVKANGNGHGNTKSTVSSQASTSAKADIASSGHAMVVSPFRGPAAAIAVSEQQELLRQMKACVAQVKSHIQCVTFNICHHPNRAHLVDLRFYCCS